jgi:nucleoside-diphosphate-sugar epimerase
MRIFVTGGTGFVLSNVVRHLLRTQRDAHAVVLDSAAPSAIVESFFERFADRLQFVQGDVRDQALLRFLSGQGGFSHVVHGATVTHDAQAERRDPVRYIDVNLNGTVSVLEWQRAQPGLERLIHVSTGGVYGDPTSLSPVDIQPESGPFDPPELYAVSKYAAELVARRYGVLFRLPVCRIRLSDVFGPMERPTGARSASCMSLPYRMMRATIEHRPLRVSKETLDAAGDFLSAEDVAEAVARLLFAPSLSHDVFNIAAGRRYPVVQLFECFRHVIPQFTWEAVPADREEVRFDPENRLARYNAYSISRIRELGWNPRPLEAQLKSYAEWVDGDPQRRCPKLDEKST